MDGSQAEQGISETEKLTTVKPLEIPKEVKKLDTPEKIPSTRSAWEKINEGRTLSLDERRTIEMLIEKDIMPVTGGNRTEESITKPSLINPEVHKTVREFTKSTPEGRQDRQQVAQQLKQERKETREYPKRIQDVTSQLENLRQRIEQKRINTTEATAELNKISGELSNREVSLVWRVMDRFLPQGRENLEDRKRLKETRLKRDSAELAQSEVYEESLAKQLQEVIASKSRLKDAKQTLAKFYQEQGEKLQVELARQAEADLEDQKAREIIARVSDIKNIVKEGVGYRGDVYFIHSIRPDIKNFGNNSALTGQAEWLDKMAVVLTIAPDISVSTIRKGDSIHNMWGAMGVVLSGGSVEAASNRDMGSMARGTENRKVLYYRKTAIDMSEKLTMMDAAKRQDEINAVLGPRIGNSYNEWIIDGCEVAGFYVCLDNPGVEMNLRHYQEIIRPHQEIYETMQAIGMPIYVVKDGVFYASRYDPATKTLLPMEEAMITPKEMIERRYVIPEDKKLKLEQQAKQNLCPEALV